MGDIVIDGTVRQLDLQAFVERLRSVRLLILDVDGVLTDAGMYYTENGDELKKFNTRDGMGIKCLKRTGVTVAIITGENTNMVARRAEKLGISIVHQGIDDKLPVLETVAAQVGCGLDEVAYIGDDIGDLPCLKRVGVPCTVADGVASNKAAAVYITQLTGGHGAVRELCDLILQVQTGGAA